MKFVLLGTFDLTEAFESLNDPLAPHGSSRSLHHPPSCFPPSSYPGLAERCLVQASYLPYKLCDVTLELISTRNPFSSSDFGKVYLDCIGYW